MCKKIYLIRDKTGYVLDIFEGTAKACQKHMREEFHEEGISCVMERASRADVRKEKEESNEVR